MFPQNPASYLSLPWHTGLAPEPAGGNHHFSRTGREGAWVQTLLCSTKLTQNSESDVPSLMWPTGTQTESVFRVFLFFYIFGCCVIARSRFQPF